MKINLGGRAVRGFTAITGSAVIGQLFVLVGTPILTRLYEPSSFGAFALLSSAVAIATTAGSLRLDLALHVSEPPEERGIISVTACAGVVAGLICAYSLLHIDHEFIKSSGLIGILLVTYLVWVSVMYTVLGGRELRYLRYRSVATRNVLQSFGIASGQIVSSIWDRSALGLAVGLTLGRTAGVTSLIRAAACANDLQREGSLPMSKVLKRHWRFPIVFMPSGLLNVLGTQLPVLVVASNFGSESTGNLAQATMLAAVPAALVGNAMSSVFRAELAQDVRNGEVNQRSRYLRLSGLLVIPGAVWFAVLVTVAPLVMPWFLGPAWSEAGRYVQATAASSAVGLVVAPLTAVFSVYEKSLANVGLDALRILAVGSLGVAAVRSGMSATGTVLLMSISMAGVYLAIWLTGLRIASCQTVER